MQAVAGARDCLSEGAFACLEHAHRGSAASAGWPGVSSVRGRVNYMYMYTTIRIRSTAIRPWCAGLGLGDEGEYESTCWTDIRNVRVPYRAYFHWACHRTERRGDKRRPRLPGTWPPALGVWSVAVTGKPQFALFCDSSFFIFHFPFSIFH